MITTDPYNLQRFLGAQESFYAQALNAFYNGERDDLTLQILKLIQKL